MALNLTTTIIDDEDYDGNAFSYKQVIPAIDGKALHEHYSYPISMSAEDIQTAVEADLTAKGYTW